jgi:hypothetical protein
VARLREKNCLVAMLPLKRNYLVARLAEEECLLAHLPEEELPDGQVT